ncbi:DUF4126 domain-containing protein [Wenzhouxiangella marina]|uniref:3-deoxy-manno-octulosonate cytidylyltransferase n=1 Tax=Wenzhouxiangella marina TaxID=1579979 RepID=A0A0K0XXQ6_9GAMM|nr:DUF4126 domain-containing protein [Wenzhouxiangella marina]AKS42460.1 3-deoxy-manno-octulosonate cytidylyltransferase [Wenzhouxiangella marina]MBB6085765.1 hypothetical protein [Wenzhouxiangella marina]
MIDALSDIGTLSALLAGISLSAAAGLRVFIPILALGLAARSGVLELGAQFQWMASDPVLLVVGVAALFETGAYYIPWVDNLLDLLATPAALGGGTVIVSSLLPEMEPAAQWTTAALLGGGSAGIVQAATVAARGVSTATSGGLGNFLIASVEAIGSVIAVILALLIPIAFGLLVIVGLIALLVWVLRRLLRRSAREPSAAPPG